MREIRRKNERQSRGIGGDRRSPKIGRESLKVEGSGEEWQIDF